MYNTVYFKSFLPVLIVMIVTLFAGCNQQVNENIERGTTYQYREGFPEVRLSAIGLFDAENNAGINITADIVYGSLIYSSNDSGNLEASLKAGIEIKNRENDKTVKRK